jgi:hypothetical protein
MAEEANEAASYPDHGASEQPVSTLQEASVDVTELSTIGKGYHTDEKGHRLFPANSEQSNKKGRSQPLP